MSIEAWQFEVKTLIDSGFSLAEEQGPCTINYNEALELLRQNPDIQDGPDFPECDENGLYTPRQCSDWTQICWCVDPEIGSAIPGTEHRENCTGNCTALAL